VPRIRYVLLSSSTALTQQEIPSLGEAKLVPPCVIIFTKCCAAERLGDGCCQELVIHFSTPYAFHCGSGHCLADCRHRGDGWLGHSSRSPKPKGAPQQASKLPEGAQVLPFAVHTRCSCSCWKAALVEALPVSLNCHTHQLVQRCQWGCATGAFRCPDTSCCRTASCAFCRCASRASTLEAEARSFTA
jgi:hypothetical protein